MTDDDAVVADARNRLPVLFEIRRRLLPDQDDPQVLSELVSVESRIRSALAALDGRNDGAFCDIEGCC